MKLKIAGKEAILLMGRLFTGLLIAFIVLFVNAVRRGLSAGSHYDESRYREEQRRFHDRHREERMQRRSSDYRSQNDPPRRSSEAYRPASAHPSYATQPKAPSEPLTPEQKQANELAAQARTYIDKIREINQKIPDEEMSAIIDRIEQVTVEIFNSVKANPESAAVVRRFLSYYLPTTLKLLETYVQFDTKTVQTNNITQTKQKIKDTLNMLLDAFYKLHDSIYDEQSMDVMNEITAMESILTQEGLISREDDNIHQYFEKGLM